MKVEIAFINFQASKNTQALVASRIEDCVQKYSHQNAGLRVRVDSDGRLHQVKIQVTSGDLVTSVSASASELGKAMDMAIDKLDAALRRLAARRKTRRSHPTAAERELLSRASVRLAWGRGGVRFDNAFDRFEDEFVEEFELKDIVG